MAYRRLEVDYGIQEKIRKLCVGLFFLSLSVVLILWYQPSLKKMRNFEQKVEAQKKELAALTALHRCYQEQLTALRHDPEAIEREARQKLRVVKPEETIYRFEPAPSAR